MLSGLCYPGRPAYFKITSRTFQQIITPNVTIILQMEDEIERRLSPLFAADALYMSEEVRIRYREGPQKAGFEWKRKTASRALAVVICRIIHDNISKNVRQR